MELGGSPRETGARPRGIPGLCNHQFAYPIQFWSHSSRPPRPASPFARSSHSSSFPISLSSPLCLFLSLYLYRFRQRLLSSPLSPFLRVSPFLFHAQQFLIRLIFILQFLLYTFFSNFYCHKKLFNSWTINKKSRVHILF